MSLFDTRNTSASTDAITGTVSPATLLNAASLKWFKSYLSKIDNERHYHLWTGGQWNMHDLLSYLLTHTGKSDLFLTTYSISEDSIHKLIYMLNTGVISSVNMILDYSAKEYKSNALLLAQEHFNVALCPMHAKVCAIRNVAWNISITGSANWTRNPKAERLVICTSKNVVNDDIAMIESLLRNEQPFKVRL